MSTSKAQTYTEDQVSKMVAEYTAATTDEARAEVVDSLSLELGKTVASVRSKLVREGVYVRKERKTKSGDPVVSKADLVTQIADAMQEDAEVIESLEKATKVTLQKVLAAVTR